MPKIEIGSVSEHKGSGYPHPYQLKAGERVRQWLGDAGGLSQFGVNLLQLPKGTWSAQRHWHSDEDEFVWVLSGEVTLIDDEGEHVLRAGECAAFPKGQPNGHHLVNNSDEPATVLEIGTRSDQDVCEYPDIDLRIDARIGHYTHKDGTPYPPRS